MRRLSLRRCLRSAVTQVLNLLHLEARTASPDRIPLCFAASRKDSGSNTKPVVKEKLRKEDLCVCGRRAPESHDLGSSELRGNELAGMGGASPRSPISR